LTLFTTGKFFPDSVFTLMSTETNRHAQQFFDSVNTLPPTSRFHKWKPTTPEELKSFVALQIEMGLDWRYWVTEYWSTRSLSPGGFGSVMSQDRFLLLQSFLHFSDSTLQPKKGEPTYNPLYKIQPVLDLTTPTYEQVYQPGRDLSVDESMIKYKSRLVARVSTIHARQAHKVWYQRFRSCGVAHGVLFEISDLHWKVSTST